MINRDFEKRKNLHEREYDDESMISSNKRLKQKNENIHMNFKRKSDELNSNDDMDEVDDNRNMLKRLCISDFEDSKEEYIDSYHSINVMLKNLHIETEQRKANNRSNPIEFLNFSSNSIPVDNLKQLHYGLSNERHHENYLKRLQNQYQSG